MGVGLAHVEVDTFTGLTRILDYLAGAVHVAGGVITKVSKTTIVIAPKNVDVSSIEALVSNN